MNKDIKTKLREELGVNDSNQELILMRGIPGSNLLYHHVLNISRLKSILESGYIFKNENIIIPSISLTRNKDYLRNRGIRMVFDRDKLRYNYKVKPFCIFGWYDVNDGGFFANFGDEMEERCHNNIHVIRCCLRIDVDKNKYPTLDFDDPLINHTYEF